MMLDCVRGSILKKGSRMGYLAAGILLGSLIRRRRGVTVSEVYFWLPQRVVCSRICGTPVSSGGFVLKPIENTLLLSSRAMWRCSAPVLSCCRCSAVKRSSGSCFSRSNRMPWSVSPVLGQLLVSDLDKTWRAADDAVAAGAEAAAAAFHNMIAPDPP